MSGSDENLPDWDDDFDVGTGSNLFGRSGASGYFLKNMSQPTTVESNRYPMQGRYQGRDSYSKYMDEERGFRSTESSVAPPEKKPIVTKSFEEQKSKDSTENAKPTQPFIDSIELRSWLLNLLEGMQASSDCFRRLEQHIGREADLDQKAIEAFLQPLSKRYRNVTAASFQHIPREATILEDQFEQHLQSIRSVLVECYECFQRKRVAYQSQLRRVRDNSNMAIRNVMQLEREQTLLRLEQQQNETTTTLNTLKQNFLQEKDSFEQQIHSNQAVTNKLQSKLEELQECEHNRLSLQQQAVTEAVSLQKLEFLEQIQQLKLTHQVDLEKCKEEEKLHVLQLQQAQERALEEIRNIESDRRHILEQERNQYETDNKILQQQISELTLQLTITREKHALALHEEQTQHEKIVSTLMTEGLSTQATLKSEITQTLHRLQHEENARFTEVEMQFNRLRDQLVHSHAIQIEQLTDRHRYDLQRQKAELEVTYNEQLMKIKHIHEQELNRQIRATDRLQRLVARHGYMPQQQQQQDDSEFTEQIEEQERQLRGRINMTSLTPPRGFKPTSSLHVSGSSNNNRWMGSGGGRVTDSPPPPPPPPLPTQHQQQGQGQSQSHNQSQGLNWGPLRQLSSSYSTTDNNSNAMAAAKKKNPPGNIISSFRPFPAPPNTLPLDEALAATKHTAATGSGGNSQGISISSNVRRVSSYLQALEEYLEGNGGDDGSTTAKVQEAVDEVLILSNKHHRLLNTNDSSDSQSDSLDGLRVISNRGRDNNHELSTTGTTDSRMGKSLLGGISLSDV